MFFSWLFLLFLASYGFLGAQSYVAHEPRSESAAAENYRARRLALRDTDHGYYPTYDDDIISVYSFNNKNKDFDDKKLAVAFTKFIMGGIAAISNMLPADVVGRKRNGGNKLRAESTKNEMKEKIKMLQAQLDELENQGRVKPGNQSKRFLSYN